MIRLEGIKPGLPLTGLDPAVIGSVVAVVPKLVLGIVLVGEGDAVEVPFYISNPFDTEPGWGVSSVNYDLVALLKKRISP